MEEFFLSPEEFANLPRPELFVQGESNLVPVFNLIDERGTVRLGHLNDRELDKFLHLRASESPEESVGIVRELPTEARARFIDFPFHLLDTKQKWPGVWVMDQSVVSWTIRLVSDTATSLRVEMEIESDSQEASVYVTDGSDQVFGPYKAQGAPFWSHTIKGAQLYVQLQMPMNSFRGRFARISLNRVLHGIVEKSDTPGNDNDQESKEENSIEEQQKPAVDCNLKPYCIPSPTLPDQAIFDLASLAVAKISYVKGAFGYVASGGLLYNSNNRPLFLTANHCVASEMVASSLEAIWQYRTKCDLTAGGSTHLRTLGSKLIATSPKSDFSLLQLNSLPPTGSYYFRWATDDVSASNGMMYRIHHPHGNPQHYQITQIRNLGGCSVALGSFIYSNPQNGTTAAGSSGSPCFRAKENQAELLGQLYGACSANPRTCGHANVDGAFAVTYPMIKPYL